MGKILTHYTKYIKDVPDYKKWNTEQETKPKQTIPANLVLKQKAKAISAPILLFDKYEHERTEDAESAAALLKDLRFTVSGTKGWNDAQVTRGGVELDEVKEETMESKLVNFFQFIMQILLLLQKAMVSKQMLKPKVLKKETNIHQIPMQDIYILKILI